MCGARGALAVLGARHTRTVWKFGVEHCDMAFSVHHLPPDTQSGIVDPWTTMAHTMSLLTLLCLLPPLHRCHPSQTR